MRYLDPVALARLKNLRLVLSRQQVEGHLSGRHRSSRRGFSQEFAQHRAYVPGDELKRLDWKVYARKDRFFVKEFQEEKSLKTYLMVDASGSMSFCGKGAAAKWDAACRLAMSLAYLVLVEGDAAGLLTFDTRPRSFIPPVQRMSHLELMDRTLESTRPAGETDLALALRHTVGRIPRRSRVFLLSDLLGDSRRILETLKAFHARRHELFILQVLDPLERDLDLDGPVIFEGLEDRGRLLCEAGLLRSSYRQAFALQQRLYQASFHGSGISFLPLYTDMPSDRMLTRFLATQRR